MLKIALLAVRSKSISNVRVDDKWIVVVARIAVKKRVSVIPRVRVGLRGEAVFQTISNATLHGR